MSAEADMVEEEDGLFARGTTTFTATKEPNELVG